MTHRDCQEKLLEFAYGELGPSEAAAVEAHLEGCEACRAELACLGGTRAVMRRLEPEPPPKHGEHLLLTAARQAAERRREQRAWLPPWVWRLSLTAAALAVVGTVSFRILSVRDRPLSQEIEGRPEAFAARVRKAAPTVAEAPAPSTAGPVAGAPRQPAAPPQPAPADMAKAAAPEKAKQFALAPPKDERRGAEVSAGTGRIAEAPQRPATRSGQAPASIGSATTSPQPLATRSEQAPAIAGSTAEPLQQPAGRSGQASADAGSVAESLQQPVGRGLVPRRPAADKAAKEVPTTPAERQVPAEAEASRDRLAADSMRFAQPPPPPSNTKDEPAIPRSQALAAPAAKPAPAPTVELKRKKAEVSEPMADSLGVSGGAAMDRVAQAPRSESTAAAEAAAEPAAPPAARAGPAAPQPVEATPGAPLLTANTWQRDRRVLAVQKLVREIDEAQRHRRLTEASRPFQACGPGEDAERRLYTLEGRTVKYVRQVGGRDLALTIEQLYDRQGRLRYVLVHGGAVSGAVVDHRIWLDEDQRRLWEAQKWRRGRYPLPEVWPEEDLTPQAPGPAVLECGVP